MSSNNTVTSLLQTPLNFSPWLSYYILDLEHTEFELKTGVWRELLTQMANKSGKTNIDSSLKKASQLCKIQTFGSSFLSIYRWAQLALDTPSHPLMPLFWQKFFILYLTRVPATSTDIDRGGVGNKFFDGVINQNFLKKIKKSLQDSVDYYKSQLDKQPSRQQFYKECVR